MSRLKHQVSTQSGEPEIHFDARRQEHYKELEKKRSTGELDGELMERMTASAASHTPKPLDATRHMRNTQKLSARTHIDPRPHPASRVGPVHPSLEDYVQPIGDIGFQRAETRTLRMPPQPQQYVYQELPTDAYRKLAEQGKEWGIGSELRCNLAT